MENKLHHFSKDLYIEDIIEAKKIYDKIKKRTGIKVDFQYEDGLLVDIPKDYNLTDNKDTILITDPKNNINVLEIYECFGELTFTLYDTLIGTLKIHTRHGI